MSVKITFDAAGNPELPILILAKKNGDKLGKITAQNVNIADYQNEASELQFDVYKYLDGELDPLWIEILNFRLVWCKDWDVWFQLTVEISESDDTIKTVSCKRLGQAELSQIKVYNTEINTENDIARDDYIEPTVLYNPDNTEASLLHRIMEKAPHYSVIHVDDTIANIQRTFTFDSTSIYDAFQEIAEEIGCLFVFNSNSDSDGKPSRTISVYDLESNCASCGYRGDFTGECPECGSTLINEGYGEDTTIFVSAEGLGENIEFTTDTDSVKNCFRLEAGDDLMTATIINCNPNGTAYLWYITDDTKKDMSSELVEKLEAYDELYDYYQNDYVAEIPSDLLESYNELIGKYQSYYLTDENGNYFIDEDSNYLTINSELDNLGDSIVGYSGIMNALYNTIDLELYLESELMPDASLSDTSASEQAALITAENLSPVAVTSLASISLATANSAVLAMAKVIVDSRYQVRVEKSSLTDYTWTGSFSITNYSDEDDTAVSETIDIELSTDYEEYLRQMIKKELTADDTDDLSITGLFSKKYDAFCLELTKYCLASLTSFRDSCQTCLDILIEQGVADGETWADEDPDLYTELYEPYYEKLCAIESEMTLRQNEIEIITGAYNTEGDLTTYGMQNYIEDERNLIQDALDFEAYIGEELWLEFCTFRREDTYSNSNYISDGLNNAELFENAREFIEVANKEIYKSAELQHSITTTLKNLLVIEEFKPLTDYFEIGNWIRVLVDDVIYKLRLISYTIDFDDLSTLSVEFSDVLKVANGVSDLQSIISQASSMATSYSATQRQASQGSSSSTVVNNWRANGLDVTNTKIISGADQQSQTWDSHGMLFRKYNAITDSYEPTQSKIINSTYAITDDNWRTIRTAIGNFYYVNPTTGELISAYGVNGEVIVGNLILGESLGIYTADGSMTFDENGLIIDTSSGTAFTITNGDNVQFYIDADGNVVLDNGATITWGNIDLTDLFLSSGNIVVYDSNGEVVYDEDGNPIDITTYTANYINSKYLTAEYITSNCIDTQYLDAEKIDAYLANIVTLNTSSLYAEVAKIANAEIESLTADYVTTEILNANIADITDLFADYATIEYLNTNYLTTESLKAAYATIDFANIGEAAIRNLYSVTGFIKDITVEDGTYTGTLHAVTFEADSIYANSIVLKGEDGLFYKLNTDGVTVTAEQTEYNALSGTILIAKSVTADKIYVSDLYAFDATIGGFIIDENAIHSTVKASVDNTTPGIYMDNTGQFAVGDSSGYIKFYYDEENDIWKLDISASSIHFGSGTDLEESLSQTIVLEERYFLNSTSPTEAPSEDDSSWVTSSEYTWLDGFYTWEKIITLYADATTSVDIFCISGNTGNDGEDGEDGEDAVTLIIDSSNGDSFKNTAISTTLTVNIIVGGNYIDSSAKMYAYFGDDAKIVWETRGHGDTDYTTLSADDSRLSDNGFIFTLTTNDVNTKLVCRCYLEIGEEEATYLTDENGNYLIDEDSNYLTI